MGYSTPRLLHCDHKGGGASRGMGRSPCCDDNVGIKKGPWMPEEDKKLVDYMTKHGHGSWRALPKLAGLNRCGKSCRLRWANYLRPDIKRGKFSNDEDQLIIKLHSVLGNKWSTIAQHLPGRTDNEIKNYWNTKLRKKLLQRGIDPITHRPRTDHLNLLTSLPQFLGAFSSNTPMNLFNMGHKSTDITQLAKAQMLQGLLQVLITSPPPSTDALKLWESMPLHQPLYNHFAATDSSLEGLANFPINFAPNQTPFLSNSSSLAAYQVTQTTVESGGFGGDYKLDGSDQLRTIWPPGNSLPALVSDSPECSATNQMENLNSSNMDVCKPSSSTDNAWGELEGYEAGDNYWKEILDQVHSPSWTIS